MSDSGKITLALAGNPNAGKTTMFNALTGARQHVGNYPGITVERKEGFATLATGGEKREFHITDLPGAYSLTAYTQEELVARNHLVDERPDAVIHVLNAGSLERNLYLTVQFLELGVPVALGLNMMDEARKKGLTIDSDKLGELMSAPVVETVARAGKGVKDLLAAAGDLAETRKDHTWSPLEISYGPDLDPAITEMTEKIEAAGFLTDRYPSRWLAVKYMEGDEQILTLGRNADIDLAQELEAVTARVSEHCQSTMNTYPEAVIADFRYGFIASLLKQGIVRREPLRERIEMSDRLDKVLTHRALGPALMLGVLLLVYQITFSLGQHPMDWLGLFFGWLGETAESLIPEGLVQSLVVSGIIDGVGGVLSFVPLILIIFFLIAFLEDSGYMARIAYMMDRVFRMFGLHGSSVMPFIVSGGVGGGCAVPGVMASRTLRSRKEKLATLLTAPFMACGAKLPVFILLAGVFFPHHEALALFLITLSAWAFALFAARILRSTLIRGPSTPFVMELPPYRMPTLRGLIIHTWERTWQYIKKAGTVILAISILLWAAMTFPPPHEADLAPLNEAVAEAQAHVDGFPEDTDQATLAQAEDDLAMAEAALAEAGLANSLAGRLGRALEPVSQSAGFEWRTNIALIGGVAAKEVIISTLGTAYSLGDVDPEEAFSLAGHIRSDPTWTTPRGIALILFILLYSPCFVTVVAIRQEAGSWKWALFSIVFNTALAFGVAVAVYQGGAMLL